MCDWCSESIPTSTSVTDISGSLKFCSFLCLNKYKMNLFCMEAQQHLPQLQKDMAAQMNCIAADQKMLITPELWLSDGNSSDHGNCEAKKCKTSRESQQGKLHAAADLNPVHKIHETSSGQDHSRSRTSPKHSNSVHSKKRHKLDSNPETGTRNSKNSSHDHHHHHKTNQSTTNRSQLDSTRSKSSHKHLDSNPHSPYATAGQTDPTHYHGSSPNLPLFFLHPWLGSPHIPPNLHTLLLNPLLPGPQSQSFHNFPASTTQTAKAPLPAFPTPTVSCPLLFPIPVPIPIPIFIPRDPSKQETTTRYSSSSESQPYKPPPPAIPKTSTEGHSPPGQAIDFSFHKATRNSSAPSPEPNPPTAPPHRAPLPSLHKIKTEPEEPNPAQPTKAFTPTLEVRPSYAERRSLILDAPPPTKMSQPYNCLLGPRRVPHSRKRCYSVHIKTK